MKATQATTAKPVLLAHGITKHFGGVQALNGVDFELRAGEIHGLIGENGAGKSTFVRIVAGDIAPDAGRLFIGNEPVTSYSTFAAARRGVSVIHQEILVVPWLTVAENILLGHFPRRLGFYDRAEAVQRARAVLVRLGAEINPSAYAAQLTLGQQQLVEIAKALAVRSRVLILDEPTAALTRKESATLFRVLRSLRDEGVAILYISHRLDELRDLVDRVTVFRDGCLAATRYIVDTTVAELIELMTGKGIAEYVRRPGQPGEAVLEVEGIGRSGQFSDVSFVVRRGENLGLYGLLGSGQDPVIRTLAGELRADTGVIRVRRQPLSQYTPQTRRAAGIGYVPSDRKREGLALPLRVRDNITLANLPAYTRFGLVDGSREMKAVLRWMERLRIRPGLPELQARKLSGGNQQKVVLARWLDAQVSILLLNEPTRGVDVATRREIYRLIDDLRAAGLAILTVSSDVADITAMCDRVIVMRHGRIEGTFAAGMATQDELLRRAVAGEVYDV